MKTAINFIILIKNRFLRTAKRKRVYCADGLQIYHTAVSDALISVRTAKSRFSTGFSRVAGPSFSDHVARAASHVGQRRILLDRIRALKGKVSEIILELFPGRLSFSREPCCKTNQKFFFSRQVGIRGVV